MKTEARNSLNVGMGCMLVALVFSCGGGKSSERDGPGNSPEPATNAPEIGEVKVESAGPDKQILANSGDASSESSVSSVVTENLPAESELQELVDLKLLSPDYACFSTSDQTVEIRGTCHSGEKIRLEGDLTATDMIQPLGKNEIVCQDDQFLFMLSLTDGIHYVEVLSDLPGRTAPALTIIVDRTRPAPVQIIRPLLNTVASGDSSLLVQGYCEIGATVMLRGDIAGQTNCSTSGQFAFDINAPTPGTYNMALTQLDSVGLQSDPVDILWTFDNSIPPAPTLIAPASLSPFTPSTSLEIRGTCLETYQIRLNGAVPGGSQDQICSGGLFSFLVEQTQEGTYSIQLYQSNPNNFFDSNPISILWTIDNTAPTAVTLSNYDLSFETPGPTTLLGNCEAMATVILAGNLTRTVQCGSNGHYAMNLDEPMDGEYRYELYQRDSSGNESVRTSVTWTRNNTLLPAPVLITPLTREFVSSSNKLILSGTCVKNSTVFLSMSTETVEVINPPSALEQDCTSGTFSYTLMLPLSISFASTTLAVWQEFADVSSATISITWTYDRIAPQAFFTSVPANQTFENAAAFAFHADDSESLLECRLDSDNWFSCASELRLENLPNGQHTFEVRARDTAGNLSGVISHSWQQISHQTLTLLHFDANAELFDSSLFSEIFNLEIQSAQTQPNAEGRFAEGLVFNGTRGDRLLASLTPPFQALSRTATWEAWVNFDAFGSVTEQSVMSLGTADQPCLKFSLIKIGGRQSPHRKMVLTVALADGTTARINSGNFTLTEGGGHFHQLAVTFNLGEVRFYLDGIQKGRGTAGVLGSSILKSCQGFLSIGGDLASGTPLSGTVDELRISKVVRYPGAFVPSAQPFNAD